ncbi:hypothetical protein ACFVS2_26040 [Brevibacillus sp. NPDC058079]|uniref:hypothetical protein n=1 Tax=Brevibacillus sp. NPDC058079 TaxID=3346330 RepID=UPI0036F0A266
MRTVEEMVNRVKDENEQVSKGVKPNYVVFSEQIGYPCVTKEVSEFWYWYMKENGVETQIADVSQYNWDENPANFRHHNTATEEGKFRLFQALNPNQVADNRLKGEKMEHEN